MTHDQVGSSMAGWFSGQPLFDWILEVEPDLLAGTDLVSTQVEKRMAAATVTASV